MQSVVDQNDAMRRKTVNSINREISRLVLYPSMHLFLDFFSSCLPGASFTGQEKITCKSG